MSTPTKTERGFTIVRRLEAPRELVFRAWTEPEHLVWFENPGHPPHHPTTVDLRVGGAWRLHMVENPDKHYMTGGVYREIVPPEKLVFSWGASDGWPEIDADRPDDGPIVTITLNEVDGATEMVFHVGFADHVTEERIRAWFNTGMRHGWNDTVDRLAPYLATLA
jgi:uncharacterized protein YndB with AHSA1/START domain